jgi:phenylalanyl-tRNA synthetase alpha chain
VDLDQQIDNLSSEARNNINQAKDAGELEKWRVYYLGRNGRLTQLLKQLGKIDADKRPILGKKANQVKTEISKLLEVKMELIAREEESKVLESQTIDISLPGRQPKVGYQHVISQIIEEITNIFISLGYTIAEGPEIEFDWYNFEALNTPPDHPARSLQDTFYISEFSDDNNCPLLLRTHTSPVQIRVMESRKPPIYVVCPGRTYRRDVADPSHSPMFHQIEGLVVDKEISFADLKGTLEFFVQQVFGKDRKIRLRPHFFPFTEPSAEVDVSCTCQGQGCRICGGNGWLEILGCGMVDPNVFVNVGYDPEIYPGFAFGMGVERIAMLKYGISDIRLFFENDLRFLKQF